jgi:hypothetical protein
MSEMPHAHSSSCSWLLIVIRPLGAGLPAQTATVANFCTLTRIVLQGRHLRPKTILKVKELRRQVFEVEEAG